MKASFASLLWIACLLIPMSSYAQAPADKTAIQAIVQRLQSAWNRGDAEAFAANFAADGSFTNVIGMQTYGKAPFLKQHERIFSTIYKGSHNEFTIGTLRFIRTDVAVADVDSVLSKAIELPPGILPYPDGSVHAKLQVVLSKENGTWQIDAFHNVAVNPAISAQPH